VIDTLAQLVAELQRQSAWLYERLTLNFKTSSLNGSGSANRVQRRVSPRKHGAQTGHSGSHRALVDESRSSTYAFARVRGNANATSAAVQRQNL